MGAITLKSWVLIMALTLLHQRPGELYVSVSTSAELEKKFGSTSQDCCYGWQINPNKMLTRTKLSMAFGFLKVQLLFWGLKFFKSTPMEKLFLCYGCLNYGLKQSNVAFFLHLTKGTWGSNTLWRMVITSQWRSNGETVYKVWCSVCLFCISLGRGWWLLPDKCEQWDSVCVAGPSVLTGWC